MNVIVIYDFGHVNGGAAQVAISSAIALAKKGYSVTYFCAVGPVDEMLQKTCSSVICLQQLDIKTDSNILRKSINGIWNKKARVVLKKMLEKYNPKDTIVHVHGWAKALSPSILNVPSKMGFEMCITLHDFFSYCPNGGLYNYKKEKICEILPMTKKCLICNCDRDNYFNKLWRYTRNYVQNIVFKGISKIIFITISDLTEREYRRCYRFNNSSCSRVNNPIIFPENLERSEKGDSYLFMGRLSNEKGVALFCEAITRLGLKGIVLGDGILKENLVNKYTNIVFAGWVSNNEKKSYIQRVKAFVSPSVCYETFGLSVAEMLSVGVPCIVGDKTAAAELIENGINGLIFETGNINSLIEAIKKVEEDSEINGNFEFERTKYTIDMHVMSLMTLYEDMLKN